MFLDTPSRACLHVLVDSSAYSPALHWQLEDDVVPVEFVVEPLRTLVSSQNVHPVFPKPSANFPAMSGE